MIAFGVGEGFVVAVDLEGRFTFNPDSGVGIVGVGF